MKRSIIPTLLIALLAAPGLAQQSTQDHSAHGATKAASPAGDMADGQVRKVDKETGKVTLRHGEIRNLDMPPMTMVFQVSDPALLDRVKTGDTVKFRAEKSASGYVVTAIEAAP